VNKLQREVQQSKEPPAYHLNHIAIATCKHRRCIVTNAAATEATVTTPSATTAGETVIVKIFTATENNQT
jgi:hypothetical protein